MMDDKTPPPKQDSTPLHQQESELDLLQQPTAQTQSGSEGNGKPGNLTRANMRAFNKAVNTEEARRRGHTVPEAGIGLEDWASTSSERDRRQFEQIMRNRRPEQEETAAAVKKYFDEYNAAHEEEWKRQWKEEKDRENEEYERAHKAAVDAALERIKDVPWDQAPTIRQRGELHWAEEEAWGIREMNFHDELYQNALPDPMAPGVTPSEPRPRDEGESGMEATAEGNGQDHDHKSAAVGAPSEREDDDVPEWAKDPGYIALYGPYQPGFEPWIVKQQRLQKEREQREQEQWQRAQDQKEQDQKEPRPEKKEHHEAPAAPSDYLRSLLPANFPRYRDIHGMNDMGAYLANASYAVSLGGPPSADLKYGIIVVPVGEEGSLFGKQPSDVMTPSFVQEVYDSRYARHMAAENDYHEASHDSAEFLRPRFASVASADRSLHSLDGLVDPATPVGPGDIHDTHGKEDAISQPSSLDDAPQLTETTTKAVLMDKMHIDGTEDAAQSKGNT